jgi:hypothetical protein
MTILLNPSLLAVSSGHPLFGSQWLALLVILALVTVFILMVAGVGRWLAATHPAAGEKISPGKAATPASSGLKPELLAAIVASVSADLGPGARITSIRPTPVKPPSVEGLMQQWSLEGRRQIYSSHKVR